MKWTKEEIDIIENNWETMSDEEMTSLLPSRSKCAIECKRKKLGFIRPQYKIHTFQEVLDEFAKREFLTLLSDESEYNDCHSKMRYVCQKHKDKGEQTITLGHLLEEKGCIYCGCEKLSNQSYLSKDFVQSEISKINPHVKIIEYKGATQQSKCYCTKHNKYFQKGYYALAHNKNSGCEICYAENLRASQGMGIDEFKKRLKEIHPELVVTGEYINNCTPIKIYCTAHDYTFSSKPVDILKRINCCDKSRKTYKEEYICSFIEETYGFLITRQKKFDDCKDKNYLPFDIYLDDYNVLIEYQGEQHYKPIRYSGESWEEAEEKFKYTKKHDLVKKEYCIANNIPLLEIPYWEFDDLEYYLFDSFTELNILEEI